MSNKILSHPAFQGATELELRDNKADLEFHRDYKLSKGPIEMDMLVIKKKSDATIKNEIGRIFRKHNVLEYKGIGDELNLDVFYKVIAYTTLYKSLEKHVDDVPADELTATIIRYAYPEKLFGQLKDLKIGSKEQYPGIYYLTGNLLFPMQIIVTKNLN